MPRSQPQFQEVNGLRVPLGGVNGYKGVRGKQGRKKNKYQGLMPRKKHRTGPKKTAKAAAVALAHLRHDLELGVVEQRLGETHISCRSRGYFVNIFVSYFFGNLGIFSKFLR